MRDIVIFDLDGTLALIDHRRHLVEGEKKDWDAFYKACVHDQPNQAVIDLLKVCHERYAVYIFSGRSDAVRVETEEWLRKHGVRHYRLWMRKDGDYTPDDILKRKWLHEVGAENVAFTVDDRDKVVKMWRDEGLTCFQVAPGDF